MGEEKSGEQGCKNSSRLSRRSPLTEMRSQFRGLQTSSRLDVAWNVAGWCEEDVYAHVSYAHTPIISQSNDFHLIYEKKSNWNSIYICHYSLILIVNESWRMNFRSWYLIYL